MSEEIFVIKKVKKTVRWTYTISELNNEGIIGISIKKSYQRTNQKRLEYKKITKRKGNKLYVNGKDIVTH